MSSGSGEALSRQGWVVAQGHWWVTAPCSSSSPDSSDGSRRAAGSAAVSPRPAGLLPCLCDCSFCSRWAGRTKGLCRAPRWMEPALSSHRKPAGKHPATAAGAPCPTIPTGAATAGCRSCTEAPVPQLCRAACGMGAACLLGACRGVGSMLFPRYFLDLQTLWCVLGVEVRSVLLLQQNWLKMFLGSSIKTNTEDYTQGTSPDDTSSVILTGKLVQRERTWFGCPSSWKFCFQPGSG